MRPASDPLDKPIEKLLIELEIKAALRSLVIEPQLRILVHRHIAFLQLLELLHSISRDQRVPYYHHVLFKSKIQC